MTERILLRSQINDVLNHIRVVGLEPSGFQWEKDKSDVIKNIEVYKLVHIDTGYYFKFDYTERNDYPRYAVFFPTKEGVKFGGTCTSWESLFAYFTKWIDIVKKDADLPDPWKAFFNAEDFFDQSSIRENAPFTLEEQKNISDKLIEVKQGLANKFNLSDDNLNIVQQRLSYLEEASKRLGRKDWINAAIGISFGAVAQMGLSSHVAQEVFKFIAISLSHILGGPILIP